MSDGSNLWMDFDKGGNVLRLDLTTIYLALKDGFWVPGRKEALEALERIEMALALKRINGELDD